MEVVVEELVVPRQAGDDVWTVVVLSTTRVQRLVITQILLVLSDVAIATPVTHKHTHVAADSEVENGILNPVFFFLLFNKLQ